jgi:hypothetical protein
MRRLVLTALRSGVVLGAGLALAALAGEAPAVEEVSDARRPAAAPASSGAADLPDDVLPVVKARDLVGRPLQGREGEAGPIRYLGVRLQDGAVRFLAVGPPSGPEEALRVVPWSVVRSGPGNAVLRLDAGDAALAGAPRIPRVELGELTRPGRYAPIAAYWERASEQAGAHAAGPDVAAPPPAFAGPSASGGEQPHLLVGRRAVAVLAPPVVHFGDQPQGATVRAPDGEELGRVDEVVIDLRHGRAAWVVIVSGEAPDRSLHPVPLGALAWVADAGTLRLQARAATLRATAPLATRGTPAGVDRESLAELHRRFGRTPYWLPAEAQGADR